MVATDRKGRTKLFPFKDVVSDKTQAITVCSPAVCHQSVVIAAGMLQEWEAGGVSAGPECDGKPDADPAHCCLHCGRHGHVQFHPAHQAASEQPAKAHLLDQVEKLGQRIASIIQQ